MEQGEVEGLVRQVVQEFVKEQQAKSEPAYKAELEEERKRREQLEHRLNEMAEEASRSRKQAEEAERSAAIRGELQKLGVAKVDLAYRAIQNAVTRLPDGRLVARGDGGEVSMKEFLSGFVAENPEFLPARMAGGSGVNATQKGAPAQETIELERIRPGMSAQDKDRARQEILRLTTQSLRNQ